MVIICPTVTEYELHSYRERMEQIETFAKHVHIDLMDGIFAPTTSPSLSKIWWPDKLIADIHFMYQRPMSYLPELIKLRPRLVIIPVEADVNHTEFAIGLRRVGIRAGLALLRETPVTAAGRLIDNFDHMLIFSGNPGHHKGVADLTLLDKVREIRDQYPEIEIGWDGGVNDQNAKQLVDAGVNVLNVGGFIAGAEDPSDAYAKLKTVLQG